jgi:transposase InsO family protein
MGCCFHRRLIPIDHLLRDIRFSNNRKHHHSSEPGVHEYGTPREILTDHGTQFVSVWDRDLSHHSFKDFLDLNNINHIIAQVKHPQTNGKIER